MLKARTHNTPLRQQVKATGSETRLIAPKNLLLVLAGSVWRFWALTLRALLDFCEAANQHTTEAARAGSPGFEGV